MINKKRQELLINNLKSISAEVRQRSLQQLIQIPTIPLEDKRKFAESLLQDSEEKVRKYAAAVLNDLGGSVSPSPEQNSLSSPTPEQSFSLPSQPEQKQSLTPDAPVMPQQPSVSEPSLDLPSLNGLETTTTLPPADISASPSAPSTMLDERLDPSLPDLKKINDIPTLLQHIRMLSEQKPSGYLAQLLQLSESQLEEVALSALQALLNLKDRKVAPQILLKLANENFSSQRRFLMLKIIMAADIELDTSLLEKILLREKDVIVKSGLVKVFARNSREKGLNTIISCLQDPDPRVRANTIEVIEEQGIRGCEQHIIALLQDSENRVKVNAAKFLVKNGYKQAFLTLRSMLVSSEVWLRDSVIYALGEIGDQTSLTLLKAALKDPNQGIRLSVLKSLAKINNSIARQILQVATGDPDPVVAQVANSLWDKIKDTPMRQETKAPVAPPQSSAPTTPVASSQPAQPTPPLSPLKSSAPTAPTTSPTPLKPVKPVTPAPPLVTPPQSSPPTTPVASSQSAQPTPPLSPLKSSAPTAPTTSSTPLKPVKPVTPAPPSVTPPQLNAPSAVEFPSSMPTFSKTRSAEVYTRMMSKNPEDWQVAARDIAFVMGDDQIILLKAAYKHQDERIRLAAAKILSRKRTPEAKAILEQMVSDPNDLVRSLVEKTLLINK